PMADFCRRRNSNRRLGFWASVFASSSSIGRPAQWQRGGRRKPASIRLQCHTHTENHFLFTGYEFDSEMGYYYAEAREQSPNLGRFMSPDLLGGYLEDPQTLNKYVYVRNNPLKLTDPTGLDFYEQCADTKNHKNCTQVTVGSGKD